MLQSEVVSRQGRGRAYEVVDNLRNPLAITIEDKAVDSNFLVVGHAELLNEALFVAQGAQSGHQPTIPVVTLSHVIGRGAVYEEARLVEDVDDPSGALGLEAAPGDGGALVGEVREWLQTVAKLELEVGLDVEVGVAVSPVDAPALLDDLLYLERAHSPGLVVGGHSGGGGRGQGRLGAIPGDAAGVAVLGHYVGGLCGVSGGELGPEIINRLLRCLLQFRPPQRRGRLGYRHVVCIVFLVPPAVGRIFYKENEGVWK